MKILILIRCQRILNFRSFNHFSNAKVVTKRNPEDPSQFINLISTDVDLEKGFPVSNPSGTILESDFYDRLFNKCRSIHQMILRVGMSVQAKDISNILSVSYLQVGFFEGGFTF
jgi:hypothetical protein